MNKKKLPITIYRLLVLIIFVGSGVAFFIRVYRHPVFNELFIFQDIAECERLIPDDQSKFNMERYDSPTRDKKLKDLQYNEFFGMKFQSDTLKYEIFAYEFIDAESALKYFNNVTGKNMKMPDENKNFTSSQGMSSCELIVTYQNRAYCIFSSAQYAEDLDQLLASTFSQKLYDRSR